MEVVSELDEDWLRGLDLNQRPSGYEPDELPGCSTPRSKGGAHNAAQGFERKWYSRSSAKFFD